LIGVMVYVFVNMFSVGGFVRLFVKLLIVCLAVVGAVLSAVGAYLRWVGAGDPGLLPIGGTILSSGVLWLVGFRRSSRLR